MRRVCSGYNCSKVNSSTPKAFIHGKRTQLEVNLRLFSQIYNNHLRIINIQKFYLIVFTRSIPILIPINITLPPKTQAI